MAYIENPFYNKIIDCFEKGDWESVLSLQNTIQDGVLLWPKPNKSDLDFIAKSLKELGLYQIVSVGCGSGLLEWLLESSNNLLITGLEIDSNYWNSRYARKNFIPLTFPQEKTFLDVLRDVNKALMFCYFNDVSAFHQYLRMYGGHCLIIIGPNENGKFTKPSPFDDEIPLEWMLRSSREIYGTGDFIAIYERKNVTS